MTIPEQLKKVVKIIPKTGPILQEFLGMMAGIKPCLTTSLTEKERELITREFPELTIEYKEATVANRRITVCAISKAKRTARKVIKSFVIKGNAKKTGKLLGYPKCCIKSHLYFVEHDLQYQHPKVVYQSHTSSKKHSFLINNLFNFSSRLKNKEDLEQLQQYHTLNENFPFPLFYLQFISHIPCSYDCQESINIGKGVRSLLKEYAPNIEKIITYTLSKPVLFFDIFKWIIFDGKVQKNTLYGEQGRTIFYKKVIPPISLIDFSLLNKIRRGNIIFADDNKIEIFKDSVLLHSYFKKDKTDGFILDFK